MASVIKVQLETAGGDVGTLTIQRPIANATLARVNAVFSQFTGAAALRHRSSTGDAYTSVKWAKYVTEEDIS